MSDPKRLSSRVLFDEAASEELSCGHEPVRAEREIGTLTALS